MKKQNKLRHGDINLHPVKTTEGEVVKHNGSFVVALGETTGHAHRLTVKNPNDLVIKKDAHGYFFELFSEGELTHEEHKTIKVAPGKYRQVQEREVDHFAGSITRRVVD
jgi:hypothetical protein